MTMEARITTGPANPCPPTRHDHRPCEGCGRQCDPDDQVATTTRRYFVCSTCYPTLRAGWSRGGRHG